MSKAVMCECCKKFEKGAENFYIDTPKGFQANGGTFSLSFPSRISICSKCKKNIEKKMKEIFTWLEM